MTAPSAPLAPLAISTTGVHHLSLRVTDLARARVFYVDRLGFPVLLEKPGVLLIAAGGTAIGLRGPAPETDPMDSFSPFRVGLDHLALACGSEEELQHVAEGLTAVGIEHTGVKRDPVLGNLYLAFRDPDGIKWEYYMAA